ncbi:MAG: integrase [Candidatus Bathyarchaeales archaeon]
MRSPKLPPNSKRRIKTILHQISNSLARRKFANDIITSEKLNVPESVADSIQDRVPKSIRAKHYKQLKRKADQFYPRYAEYVTELRRKPEQ